METRTPLGAVLLFTIVALAVACTPAAVLPTVALTRVPSAVASSTPPSSAITATLPPVTQTVATATSAQPTIQAAARVISFTVVPTTTQALGDEFSITWQAQGGQVSLCPYTMGPQGPIEQAQFCSYVPLAGTKVITTDKQALDWTGFQLRVSEGQLSERSLIPVRIGCKGFLNWFFKDAPSGCPESAAETSKAAAQHFEHGLMVWVEHPDRFYVFYEGAQNPQIFDWINAPYSYKPGASPTPRVGDTPPPGLFEPVSGFGQLWRDEFEGAEKVRERLGWATDKEFSFSTSYQCEHPNHSFRLWTCYLAGPDGQVFQLRPDSTAQAHFIWRIW